MRQLFALKESTANKISYFHLVAFLVCLPFDRFFSQLILASFLIHTLIHTNKEKFRMILSWQNLVLSSVFLINLFGLIYSPEKLQAGRDIQRQLAIILLPLAFSTSNFPFSKYRNNLLVFFSLGSVVTILYLYLDALYILWYNKLPITSLFSLSFINHNFSSPIGLHATYLSLYCSLALLFLVLTTLNETKKGKQIFFSTCIIVLSAGIMQLASKSVLIGLTISAIFLPLLIPKGNRRRNLIFIACTAILMALAGIFTIDSYRNRVVSGLKKDLTQSPLENEILEPRIVRWGCAWDLVTQKPILGFGSGTEKKMLKELYFERKLFNSYLNELNAHNQYLSIWIKTGVWGLLFFLLTLGYGFWKAIMHRDALFFSFMTLVAIACFSENLLDVNKGIFFYAFFFCFFVYTANPLRINSD